MKRRRTHRAAIVGAPALVLLACNAIVGLDRDYALGPEEAGSARPDASDAPVDVLVPVGDGGASDASADADADVEVPCPNRAGPTMVRVGSYCIDSTEVTERQYQAFLAADAGFGASRPPACGWKNDFKPGNAFPNCRWDPEKYPQLPVTCVDWCDAYAYCQWAGKHLCGAIDGGGAVAWDSGADLDPAQDEWYRACTKGDERAFPYGSTYDPGACNDDDRGIGKLADAGSHPDCKGGYDGVYDMVGNAFEFANSCSGNTGASDRCLLRGGSWAKSPEDFSRCRGRGLFDRRDNRYDDFGIRCCGN